MMTALVEAEISDPEGGERKLTEKELSEFVVLLDGAGTDTVSLNLGTLTRELEANPDQRELLARAPERSANAIEEILRFDAPSPVQGRLVTRDVELHRTVVPSGLKLLLINGAASRDPRAYEDPNRFDVTRRFDRHLSSASAPTTASERRWHASSGASHSRSSVGSPTTTSTWTKRCGSA
jgi:cytochrome P450